MELGAFPVILLAGGKGARMGVPKGLIEYNGRPWLEVQLKRLGELGLKHAIVVLGYQHVDYLAALPWIEPALDSGKPVNRHGVEVAVTLNTTPELGPFSSFQAAARVALAAPKPPGAVYLLPVDVPCPSATVWEELALLPARNPALKACSPRWADHNGHPILLSADFVRELLSKDPANTRLDHEVRALPVAAVERLEVTDPLVCMNLNTPEDFEKYHRA